MCVKFPRLVYASIALIIDPASRIKIFSEILFSFQSTKLRLLYVFVFSIRGAYVVEHSDQRIVHRNRLWWVRILLDCTHNHNSVTRSPERIPIYTVAVNGDTPKTSHTIP